MSFEVDHLFPFNPKHPARGFHGTLHRTEDRKLAELAWQAWASQNPKEAKRIREQVNPQHWND